MDTDQPSNDPVKPPARRRAKGPVPGLFLVGQLSEAVLPLVRSVVFARLLGVTDFGLTIALSTVIVIVEQSSDIGLNRTAVKTSRADGSRDIDTLHAISLARALTIGLLIALAGPLIARLFGAPDAWLAFTLLGLGSALRGFQNLGLKEMMRDYVFWPDGLATAAYQVGWTLFAVSFVLLQPTYWAMLVGIVGGQAVYVLLTHVLSPVRWRLGWDGDYARETLRFGAPLIPNGMSLAAKTLGDRAVIGAFLGLAEMAVYSATVMAAILPRGVITRLMTSLFLPYFHNFGLSGAVRHRLLDIHVLACFLIAFFYGVGFACFGPPLLRLIFGQAYEPGQLFAGLVAADVAVKFLFMVSVTPALSYGQTRLILFGSFGGLAALAASAVTLQFGGGLEEFVAAMLAVEWLTLIALQAISLRHYPSDRLILWAGSLVPPLYLVGLILLFAQLPPPTLVERIVIFAASTAFGLVIVAGLARLRGIGLRHLRHIRSHDPKPGAAMDVPVD